MKALNFLCLFACLLITTAAQASTVLNATLVEDTYVATNNPDTNYNGDQYEIYIRNHQDVGRLGVIQFTLPQLPAGKTAADITSVDLSGIVAYNHSTGTGDRDVSLQILGMSTNPDLTTLTYNNLLDPTGNGVVTDYVVAYDNIVYGSQTTSLDAVSFNGGDTFVGDTFTFADSNGGLQSFVQSSVTNQTQAVTLAIGPGISSPALCDFRFYSQENIYGAAAMSLTVNTDMGTYSAPLIEDTYVQSSSPYTNYSESDLDVYIRNHADAARVGLVQFDLSSIPQGASVTSVQLAGAVASTKSQNMSLEVVGLASNPDLTTVTYSDLYSSGGSSVISDYAVHTPNLTYGTQATSLSTTKFYGGDTFVGDTFNFVDQDDAIKTFVQNHASTTQAETITLAIGPGETSPGLCDFRLYSKENAYGASPISLTITTTSGSYEATLVEDAYVQSSTPDDNYSDDSNGLEIYIRNYSTVARMGLVQFDLPQLATGEEIIDVQISGQVAHTRDTYYMQLEVLGLDVNPDLTTVTYNDLFDENGDLVISGYDPTTTWGGMAEFVYGSEATSLGMTTVNTADTPVGSSIVFPDDAEGLLDFIKSNISDTEAVDITLLVGSGDSDVGNCDYRFYAKENTAEQDPVSLAITFADSPQVAGDANGDGKVDGSDVTILAGNWQKGVNDGLTATWEEGDFNGDGKVDGSDVTILAGNWQYGVEAAAASVPEPSTIMLLVMMIGSLLVWKRR